MTAATEDPWKQIPKTDETKALEALLVTLWQFNRNCFQARISKFDLDRLFGEIEHTGAPYTFWRKPNLYVALHNYYVDHPLVAFWGWIRGSYSVKHLLFCFSYYYTEFAHKGWGLAEGER